MGQIDYTQIKPEFEDEFDHDYPKKPQPQQPKPLQKKLREQGSGGSCCKCCCITFAIALTMIVLLIVAAFTTAYLWTKNQVVRLTVDEPLPPFPVVDLTQAQVDVIKDRTDLFFDTLATGMMEPPDDLVLTAHEFNGLIGHNDYLRANMYVDIQPGLFSVQMSLPADGLPGGQGRFFVETATVQNTAPHKVLALLDALHPIPDLNDPIFMADMDVTQDKSAVNKWIAILNVGEFMGSYVPPDVINQRQNLLESLYDDPETAQALNGIDSITIDEDKIVVKASKKKSVAAEGEELAYSPKHLPDDGITATTDNKGARSFLRKLV